MSKYESHNELKKKIFEGKKDAESKLEKESRISSDVDQVRKAIEKLKGGISKEESKNLDDLLRKDAQSKGKEAFSKIEKDLIDGINKLDKKYLTDLEAGKENTKKDKEYLSEVYYNLKEKYMKEDLKKAADYSAKQHNYYAKEKLELDKTIDELTKRHKEYKNRMDTV